MSTAKNNMSVARERDERSAVPSRSSPRAVAHDLRQPLAAIGALVTTAERQADVPPAVRRCLHQIKGQVEDLNKLCRQIVDHQDRQRTLVAVHELALATAEVVRLANGRAVIVSAADAFVQGDEVDLRRALCNLLENACRATASGGRVCLMVRAMDQEVRLEVHDDGPGFGRASAGSASLGLDIVEAVAAEHGGHLEISESDLGGAAVTLVLPLAAGLDLSRAVVRADSVAEVTWSDQEEDGRCVS